MPVPTYAVIADSEIDPESPITSSLMFRLRDNILALLGIDPATASPAFTIAPSYHKALYGATMTAVQITSGTVTSTEYALTTAAASNELIRILYSKIGTTSAANRYFTVGSIVVDWVAGAPTNATFTLVNSGTFATTTVVIAVNNAYQTLYTDGLGNPDVSSVKFRYSAGILYMQTSAAQPSGATGFTVSADITFQTLSFQAKT